jgi:ABC-type multidrug transport system fused ATPase/permease subunit
MQQSRLYQRHIQRLERKLAGCEANQRRYAWIRLIIFLAGVAASWGAAVLFGPRAGWVVVIVVVILFSVIVVLHRRLEHWTASFRIWKALYQEKVARLALDWEHIPLPAAPEEEPPSPLAIDLDLVGPRSLHHLLDTAISRQGSRRLSDWLTNGVPDPQKISTRQAEVRNLAGQARFRNRLALIFRQTSREPLDAEKLLGWLQTPYPEKRMRQVLAWATLLWIVNVALVVLFAAGQLPPFWILSLLAYAGVYLASQPMIGEFLAAVIRLDSELSKFRPLLGYLESFPYGARKALKQQCAPFLVEPNRPSKRLRQVQFVSALAGLRMNPFLGLLLNLLTPWDFWAAWLAARLRQSMATLLPNWLDAFHELEALISLGEFAALHPEYMFPKVITNEAGGIVVECVQKQASTKEQPLPVFTARGLGHPLLPSDHKVSNDLQIQALGELLIITGSNMAGKSTFIRTVGVNLCLAYAGGPVDATVLETIPFRLYTCIRISDSLSDGVSYFYAEVKRLKGLLDALRPECSDLPLLYLVDEIFRGTNNRERLIGSRAYVKALIGAPGVGLIATHDLDLATLAEVHPQARNVHFRDALSEGKLTFDYRLRPGPSPATNALKIMAIEGLPVVDS